jgi:hypothetical protein
VITEIILRRFRGFERYSIRLADRSVLVGPNNAGKSSAIAAVRAVAGMRRRAARESPQRYEEDRNLHRRGWSMPKGFGLSDENLRFDFLDDEVRLIAKFKGGARLEAVWPPPVDEDGYNDPVAPFFYVVDGNGDYFSTPARVRAATPEIGLVPILTPIDLHEQVRSRDTVVRHLAGRLASRHFRNQLLLLTQEQSTSGSGSRFDDFLAFAGPWMPETEIDAPALRRTEEGTEIDVFFYERRRPRELAWAGDGFQVFLQVLYHLFRLNSVETVVLDEPDVYLHPDLQRRLFQLIDSHPGQVIFASHSVELVAEAPPGSVIWIDRERRKAITSPDDATLHQLSSNMGTGFNLRLARVLRAKVVLFVEGDDMTVLRLLAKTLDLDHVVTGSGVATVSLGGASNRARLESFGWVADELLRGSVNGHVVLDRDFRSDDANRSIEQALRDHGLIPHIWERKELESYLIEVDAIGRLVDADADWVRSVLNEASQELRFHVTSRMTGAWYEDRPVRATDLTTISERVTRTVESLWSTPETAWARCPAKDLISAINAAAQRDGLRTLTAHKLARELRVAEIAPEMVGLLRAVNHDASMR